MTFEEIAPIVDRSVVATRQLASRARRRVQGQTPTSDADLRKQRRIVDAFLEAVHVGVLARLPNGRLLSVIAFTIAAARSLKWTSWLIPTGLVGLICQPLRPDA